VKTRKETLVFTHKNHLYKLDAKLKWDHDHNGWFIAEWDWLGETPENEEDLMDDEVFNQAMHDAMGVI
jgi:hypothetical protein